MKKKKSLGVPKSRVLLDTTDIYDQDDSRDSLTKNDGKINSFYLMKFIFVLENDHLQSSEIKSNNKVN